MKRTALLTIIIGLFAQSARADDPHHPGNPDCSSLINSGQITPTIVTSTSENSSGAWAPARQATANTDLGCFSKTYVKVAGIYDYMDITPFYFGPNVITSEWDCNHTSVSFAVYNGNFGGGYSMVGAGILFGHIVNGTCVHDLTSFASSGSSSVHISRYARNPIIGIDSWTHNDTAFGHPGNLCGDINCYWRSLLLFKGPSHF